MIYVPITLIRNNILPEPQKPPVHSFLSYPFSLFQRQPTSWILHSSCAPLIAFLYMYLLLNKYCLIAPHVELSINELYKNSMYSAFLLFHQMYNILDTMLKCVSTVHSFSFSLNDCSKIYSSFLLLMNVSFIPIF